MDDSENRVTVGGAAESPEGGSVSGCAAPDSPPESGRKKLKLELDNKDPDYKNPKEKIYDKLEEKLHLSVKAMDVIIAILVALFIIFLVIGFLKGDGGYIA